MKQIGFSYLTLLIVVAISLTCILSLIADSYKRLMDGGCTSQLFDR